MKENRTNQLTKEEQQEYTKLRNIKIIWEVMWKELSEEQKQRLEGFETRLSEALDASNYGIYDTREIQRNSEVVNSEVEESIKHMEEEKKNKETELEKIKWEMKRIWEYLSSIEEWGKNLDGEMDKIGQNIKNIQESIEKLNNRGIFKFSVQSKMRELENQLSRAEKIMREKRKERRGISETYKKYQQDVQNLEKRREKLNEEIIELWQKIYKERRWVFPEDGPNRPLELEEWRKLREIMTTNNETKQKIINAVNKISSNQFNVSIQKDWSRQIEFKLWEKKYKLLDINVWAHTEDKYKDAFEPPKYWMKKDALLWWMDWDNVDNWKNEKLKGYVKKKQSEWLDIPKIEEVKDMLKALWKEAGISKESDQISMLMYLTGMYSRYKLYHGRYNGELLSALICDSNPHFSNCAVQRLFMMAHN